VSTVSEEGTLLKAYEGKESKFTETMYQRNRQTGILLTNKTFRVDWLSSVIDMGVEQRNRAKSERSERNKGRTQESFKWEGATTKCT
jgi:hypothetical protein